MTSSSLKRDSIFSYFFITPPKRNEWIFTLKNVINKTPTKMTRQWLCHPPQKKRWKSPEFNCWCCWGLVEEPTAQNQKTFRWNILPFREKTAKSWWLEQKEKKKISLKYKWDHFERSCWQILSNIVRILTFFFLMIFLNTLAFMFFTCPKSGFFLECMQRNF